MIDNLPPSDIVILGGTFAGMAAALEHARAGKKVTLIESRTYLGTELTATLRPWIPVEDESQPELAAACIKASGLPASEGEYPLRLDAVKVCLEDILLGAKVRLIYGGSPIERPRDGLVIGTKGGKHFIACTTVLDARKRHLPGRGAITLEFEGATFPAYQSFSNVNGDISIPEHLGVPGNAVRVHRGCRPGGRDYIHGHVLIEVPFEWMPLPDLLDPTRRYVYARAQAIKVASYLLWEHPSFRLAYLGKIAEEVYVPGENRGGPFGIQEWVYDPHEVQNALSAASWDVIVVGGGTSGAIAGIAAASEGARTLVVEMNPGLGGTGTYGGVHAYWMGWKKGFSALSTQWTNRLHDRLRYPPMQGALPVWNIEAKIQALLEQAQAVGAELLFDARVIDAVVEDGRVVGVMVDTPGGLVKLSAKVVIDATGDGDVADFAGASYHYGSRRDGIVMWYSLGQFAEPGHIQTNFTSMINILDPEDYTRAVLWGRRRGGQLHDHAGYIAPRETRHIHGDIIQTLSDQLVGRAYPDVISLAVSNNDMKGHTSSDWMKIGLVPPNLYIEIAYGMLLPKGLDGLLVVGKALSAERDALPSLRMQPDFENLGGAAGVAAAFAVCSGVKLREVNLPSVQKRLVEIGVLPEEVLTRKLIPFHPTEKQITGWINAVAADDRPLWALSSMEVDEFKRGPVTFAALCCAGERAIPPIEAALKGPLSREARRKLARALALMGAPSAIEVLLSELSNDLSGRNLPPIRGNVRHAHRAAPDQAAMPETAYLLYALGMTCTERAIPIWQRVVDLLEGIRPEDVLPLHNGVFAYVDAVCAGAERLANPAAIPVLEKLQANPVFRGHYLPQGIQSDYLLERVAYLEIVIARALARCGSPKGALTLINYLGDVRKFFARHARSELTVLAGQDFGAEPAAWGQWIESVSELIPPQAWYPPLEAVTAWEEQLFVKSDS